MIIDLKDIHKSFGKTKALNGLNLTLNKGEVLGFIGPNGAGKTTTIRVLLGSIKAKGDAKVFGLDPWKNPVEIHKKLSYVPGDVNLWGNLTGGEVIDFFLKLSHKKNDLLKNRLIKDFDLDVRKKCRTYSKGNRQKVALISALAADSELYIFDEPTGGLDPLMEVLFQREVARIKGEGKSILLSSHILSEVEKTCDTISIIKEGKIIQSGRIDELEELSIANITIETRSALKEVALQSVKNGKVTGNSVEFFASSDDLPQIMKELSPYEITNITSKKPTLEELFMTYYKKDDEYEKQ